MTLASVLKKKYPSDVSEALLAAYRAIEENFTLRKWKASELDAGHFVEAARRLIEHELFGAHTPICAQLSNFSDGELKRYENSQGDETLRQLIPRALKAVFNIRNKRGVGHLGAISPNEMDATFILYTAKWVLAEFVRLAAGSNPSEAQKLIDAIVERRVGLLWKSDGIVRILENKMPTREQILVLLFDSSPQTTASLQAATEYQNKSNFRTLLRQLHKSRLVELSADGAVQLTPKGLIEAEKIVLRHQPK